MNREEAEAYVYASYLRAERHQAYGAKDAAKRHPELTRALIEARSGTPCVLVTGSKGKGSVAAMISRILGTRRKVGLMTSPHLTSFCERFRIDGRPISDDDFARYMTDIRPDIDAIDRTLPPDVCVSPMGIQALLGLTYFNHNRTDFNVFECGKGARYDDVNNIVHPYAVINSIFLEHTRELGDTLKAIAEDKSCVLTGDQRAAFVASQVPDVMDVIEGRAAACGVPLKVYGKDFKAVNVRYDRQGMVFDVRVGEAVYPHILVPLMGEHQARNCALAMALCQEVLGTLDLSAIRQSLRGLQWPGRMEVLSHEPFILLDACIHPASCAGVREVLEHLGIGAATVVVGIPDDKDYVGVVQAMVPVSSGAILLTRSQSPHYRFTAAQQQRLRELGVEARWTDSVEEALRAARERPYPIVVLGTTSVVSEVRGLLI